MLLLTVCRTLQVNRLLEEADDNAALGDPTYVPEMDNSLDSIATGDTSRGTMGIDTSQETGVQPGGANRTVRNKGSDGFEI